MELKLQKIMAKSLGVKEKNITENSSMENMDTWNSLNHINLIVDIEDGYGVNFTDEEIIELTSYKKIIEIIGKKKKK